MTIRPIIFSTPMVQALLAGRKTQTRRLASSPLRRVEVGDLLYVRETLECANGQAIGYPADGKWLPNDEWRWRNKTLPSIHMPRWLSRITLEVTRVTYDRLQRISRQDCQAEGHPQCPEVSPDPEVHLDAARDWFMDLWDTLHDKPGERWADDPMIVALEFRVQFRNVDAAARDKPVTP